MPVQLRNKEIRIILEAMETCPGFPFTEDAVKLLKKLRKALVPIKVRSAKNKGANLQKWVCDRVSSLLNIPYDQSDDQCLIHSREMGQSGVDIVFRGEAYERFPFTIECKSKEQLLIQETLAQAKKNATVDRPYMVVYKRKSFKYPVVIIEWDTLERILSGELCAGLLQ
jgi:hypothetical protein